MVGLGTTASVPVLVTLAGLAGVGFGVFDVGWDLTVQARIREEQLSRVYAFDQLGSFLAMPVGQVAAGPLAALVGTSTTLVGLGVVVAATCVLVPSLPAVRHLPASTVTN